MSTTSTTSPPPYGVFPVFHLTTPYLGQTSATQQATPTLGQPALVFMHVASSFGQHGQVIVAGQPAFGLPAVAIGQQVEASSGTGDHFINESDIEALMPKLCRSDYYTVPTIEELAAKEQAEPGYCGRVKDFVLGRHGAGHIKFLGETDIRWVDLDSVIQFNPGNVILKPMRNEVPNGTAEITYLCPKKDLHKKMPCHDVQSRSIKNVESFKKYLDNRGMEFVSYDPIRGEYKFRVKYFSRSGDILFKIQVGLAWKIKKLLTKIKKMI